MELDDTTEIPAIVDDDDDADAGPVCGTSEAITHLYVAYMLDDLMRIVRGRYCCVRHIPDDATVLPDLGELVSIVVIDGRLMTTVKADGDVEIIVNMDDEPGVDPTWPNDNAILRLGMRFDPPLP
jgi:hypothetical protein